MGKGKRYEFVENILKENYKKGDKVLEIAAGGAVYRDIFHDYIATDLVSTSYAKEGDIDVYCDARDLPFEDDKFDMAFVVAALYQIPDTDRVLREINRVLKAGGIFIIFDYNKKRTQYLKQNESDSINQDHIWSSRQLKKIVQKNGFHARDINHWKYFPTSENLFKDNIVRNNLMSKIRGVLFKDWNVVFAEKK